jgi:predicted negative regulator of RcsB-dependent stress response
MDAETRHKLKTNEFGEAIERLMTFSDPRLKYWLAGIIVVALAIVAYRVWSWNQQSTRALAWSELARVSRDAPGSAVAQLETLISQSSDTRFLAAARLRLANELVQEAYTAPEAQRTQRLQQAADVLRATISDASAPAPLVAAALLLNGTVQESLRDLAAARAAYEALKEPRFDGIPTRSLGLQRLDTLSRIERPVQFVPGLPPPPVDAGVGPPIPGPVAPPAEAPPAEAPATQPAEPPAP